MLKETLARNIVRYRKERGLTQEELAARLGLSFQAVSKWENAQSLPELSLLPALSETLQVGIDKLLGYLSYDKAVTVYEEEYKTPDYIWGLEPNSACYQVLQLMPPTKRLKLLDIGCGEGKDAVFFARNGYDVTAFDITDAGISKTKRLAEKTGVRELIGHYRDWFLHESSEVVFDCNSSGVPHQHAMTKLIARKVSV